MPANFVAPPPILENENCVTSQCPEFYAEDALMLSQDIYLGFEATFIGEVQGCFFHFRQALIKHPKSEKELFEKYLNNGKGKCRFTLIQLAALAFVRPEHTRIGFEALLEDAYVKKCSTIFKGYLEYFERQWVGKKVTARRGKSGATAPWNCQSACIKGEMKKSSSLKFNKFFQKPQEEQARTVSKFQDLANWVTPKKRKSKEQDYQEDVQKVVKKM
ncbi:hypothetical protein DSO57_1000768 [Entomophthora muscae]|uniref:Uncharacterized protein n=1 Tax=Entomophthora muscae TaxID=34485 RepID=A0ACC2T8V7_9FUNG|nr:hypothetical protein DSO57_1000768 [Entomophthora muscae]